MKYGEFIFVTVVTAILGLGLVLDVLYEPQAERGARSEVRTYLASGSYCPAPSGDSVQASMTTTNLGEGPLGLRRSAVAGQESAPQQSTLEPQRLSTVALGDFGLNNATGVVDAFGGRGYTSLTVTSSGTGLAVSRCSAQPSARWLFATGSTLRDDDHYLVVSNPFREEALVSVRVMGPDQDVDLPLISDEVVRALSQRVFYMSENLEEAATFGMEVTASRGRVVVSRYSTIDTPTAKGASLDVGIRRPSTQWFFAGGRVPTEGEETLAVINPSDREALISVLFMTESERVTPPELSEVAVPAGRQVNIALSDYLPRGTSHGMTVASLNEVEVVAERQIRGVVGSVRGFEAVFGASDLGPRWIVPVGSPEGGSSSVAIVNPGQQTVEVDVSLVTADGQVQPDELSGLSVPSGRKVAVDLSGYLGGGQATAVVEAGGPIAVESTVALEGSFQDFASTPGMQPR